MKPTLTIFATAMVMTTSMAFADSTSSNAQRGTYSSSTTSSQSNNTTQSAVPRNNTTNGQGTEAPDRDRTNHDDHDHDHGDSTDERVPNE